ncbi:OmcA/MtrC family decaheme c-type cytochrome [Shewanella sp. 3_MG-2023]|uniref:OmcA/MtrC family decaheme c-type cytochrome n=1 Tax=Shewanella sp. 3_MG-2023 TaxID=3062635 RepID=UPI0026E2AFDE|nr:OmcA/MtrC family decaheme c-type cytochrome [Shewanella sp. 3_MG-2023]MDO6774840.1 OmcA/MtrC family decaheme c-type cytochrome [Shewanella sp. 3_MG-2023]
MMNTKHTKIALLLAASFSVALTGCGSDGDDGKDGIPGLPGGEPAEAIQQLKLEVLSVTYEGDNPTLKVFATNEDDEAVVGLSAFEVKKVAQLIPAGATGAGNSAVWESIGSQKEFIDNKNGSYSFTIETKGFNSELTQRYNIIAQNAMLLDGVTEVPHTELSQDFDGEGYDAKYTKNIVSHDTCANCHAEGEPITTRHSSYFTQETCATCHSTNLSTESQWKHLIHNIHNSNKSFTDKNGKEYTGVTAEALIQNNCQSCHVESEELTEWGNWTRVPTMETCSSCHTGIDFEAGQGHPQQSDNSNCIACHNASWTEEIHTGDFVEKKALMDQYGINVDSTIDPTTQNATISIQVVDSNGENVDLNTISAMVQRIEIITNVGPNNVTLGYYGKDSINAIMNGVVDTKATIEGGKLVYTTSADLKLGTAGSDDETAFSFVGWSMCSEDGAFVDCSKVVSDENMNFSYNEDGTVKAKWLKDDFYTGMKADLAFATLSGQAPSMRHVDSVNFSACATCHTPEFEIHKGQQHAGFVMSEQLSHTTDANDMPIVGVDACVACHTPDGTYASGANQGAIEMKLHSVHGQQGVIKDCAQCHNDFNLDAFKLKGALASSVIEAYSDPGQKESLYTTPITATCASCHGFEEIKNHAQSQGGLVNGPYQEANDAAQLETCFFCHAPTIFDHTAVKM